jgi:hypothetical protein
MCGRGVPSAFQKAPAKVSSKIPPKGQPIHREKPETEGVQVRTPDWLLGVDSML